MSEHETHLTKSKVPYNPFEKSSSENEKNGSKKVTQQQIAKWKVLAILGGIAVVLFIIVVGVVFFKPSALAQVSIEGTADERCDKTENGVLYCAGTLNVNADVQQDGKILSRTLAVNFAPHQDGYEVYPNSTKQVAFSESEWLQLSKRQNVIREEKIEIKNANKKLKAVYNLKIVYQLSDSDKQIFANLDAERQARIKKAEEERLAKEAAQKAKEEQERIEREKREQEEARKKAEAQSESDKKTAIHLMCQDKLKEYYFPYDASRDRWTEPYFDTQIGNQYYFYFRAKIKSSAGGTVYKDVGCIVTVNAAGTAGRVTDFFEDNSNGFLMGR